MGLGVIGCEGYADVKDSGFGNGLESASDFDGGEILAGAILVLTGAVIGAATVALISTREEGPPYPAKRVTIESGPYRLDGSTETTLAHEEHANETYRIRLGKIDHELRLVGKVLMPYDVAHFNVTGPGGEERHITLEDRESFSLSANLKIHAKNVERDFVELMATEKYSEPLELSR